MRTVMLLLAGVLGLVTAACGDDASSSSGSGGSDKSGGSGGSGTTTSSAAGGGDGGAGVGGEGATGGGGGGTPARFDERVAYAHLVEPFETEEECLAAQDPELFVNCYQVVELCPDGSASLMLTDVIDPGSYTRVHGAIETTWEGASGAPPSIVFDVISATEIVDDAYGLTWTLDEEGVHRLGGCE